jgi:hypothetical protein
MTPAPARADCPIPFTLTPAAHAAMGFPPIVCLCGSTRFHDQFRAANLRLTLAGQVVLSIGCDTKSDADLAAAAQLGGGLAGVKARLDELHKRKIDLADYVLVLNVGGYIGESTRAEIAYARAAGKPVTYLQPPGRPAPPAAEDIAAGQWACSCCDLAWFGAEPENGLCPDCTSGRCGGCIRPGGAR